MKEQLKKERFTVLAHCFATFDEAREYIQQLADGGKCKVLPRVRKWIGRNKGCFWEPYVDKNGEVRFN